MKSPVLPITLPISVVGRIDGSVRVRAENKKWFDEQFVLTAKHNSVYATTNTLRGDRSL